MAREKGENHIAFRQGFPFLVETLAETTTVRFVFVHARYSDRKRARSPAAPHWVHSLRAVEPIAIVDASPEMVAISRARLGSDRVTHQIADLFAWQPARQYHGVCFGFWLSHIPADRLDGFLRTVAAVLVPGGRVFFVDGRREPTTTARDQVLSAVGT